MIIVDKDFGDKELKDELSDAILGWDPKFQWVFAPASNMSDMNGHNAMLDDMVYEHLMFVSLVGPGHPYRKKIVELFNSFIIKHKLKYTEIARIKINIVPMAGKDSIGKYQMPHVDLNEKHKVFLYYINDSDGDTYLFNETLGDTPPEKFTLDQKISPEAGKGVVFDGNIFHAPSAPTESAFRAVINLDFV